MDYVKAAKDALALIKAGRDALGPVIDAVKDGKAAIDASTIAEIDALLEAERPENRAAFDNLNNAIGAYRARRGLT
jgi:hypothetical protein